MLHRSSALIVASVLAASLVGCATVQTHPFATFYAGGQPSIAGIAPNQARVMFTIVRELDDTRTAQAISGLSYASASVTLSNTNTAVLPSALTKTVTFDGSNQAASAFTALRPGSGYAVNVSLLNGSNAQVGSGVAENINLPAGQTTAVTIVIGKDGNVSVTSSQVGNAFGTSSAYVITKGDTVVFNTGFAGTESAVSSWSVYVSSALASTSIKTKIGTFPASTNFSTFTWPTGTTNNSSGWSYTSSLLTTTGTQDGTLTFELIDASGNVVGRSNLAHVSAVAGANMDLQLQ